MLDTTTAIRFIVQRMKPTLFSASAAARAINVTDERLAGAIASGLIQPSCYEIDAVGRRYFRAAVLPELRKLLATRAMVERNVTEVVA